MIPVSDEKTNASRSSRYRSKFSAKYAIDQKWYVGTTYFFNNKTGVKLGDDADYDRIQLDTGFKY